MDSTLGIPSLDANHEVVVDTVVDELGEPLNLLNWSRHPL